MENCFLASAEEVKSADRCLLIYPTEFYPILPKNSAVTKRRTVAFKQYEHLDSNQPGNDVRRTFRACPPPFDVEWLGWVALAPLLVAVSVPGRRTLHAVGFGLLAGIAAGICQIGLRPARRT
jgi:hypothetical protein